MSNRVDEFVFLDHLEHRAFAEEEFVKKQVETYKERFGKAPYLERFGSFC